MPATDSAVFAALAEPHRRMILDALRTDDHSAGDFIDVLPLAQPTISKHLRLLRETGLVQVRTDAQRRIYSLRAEPLQAVDHWLDPYRVKWRSRLDALERHLDSLS